jgi:hypothetical protein
MASEQVPTSALAPAPQLSALQGWLGRLGLSGKLLAIGGLVGLIAVFMPLLTMSIQMPTLGSARVFTTKVSVNGLPVNSSQSVLVVGDWRGILCLFGYGAALALSFVLYPPNGLGQKALGWAGVCVGGFISLLALWLLINALNGSAALSGFGGLGGFQVSVGLGAILNLLAAAVVATGGFFKAREEHLF